jgi:hypothetical protein
MDELSRTSRSTNLKSKERSEANSLCAICRTPLKIQIEPQDSPASGLSVLAPLQVLFLSEMLATRLLAALFCTRALLT